MSEFRTLFTLSVAHTYYDGLCRDFQIVFPSDGARMLQQGRLVARELDGVFHVLYETDGTTSPLIPITGMKLRLGLRPVNPYFSYFTDLPEDFYSSIRIYRFEDTDTLALYGPVPLVAPVFTHAIAAVGRPVALTLRREEGWNIVSTQTMTDTGTLTAGFDATGWTPGIYVVQETVGATTTETRYYIDQELYVQGAIGVIDIDIDSTMYTDTQDFQIAFQAREEVMRYYVVAKNYSGADIIALAVADNGYTEDGRPQLTFTKLPSDDPGYDGMDVNLLKSGDEDVILFKSGPDVPRREGGRKKIELRRSSEVLIQNLPQPGPDKADADMIIHLSKP